MNPEAPAFLAAPASDEPLSLVEEGGASFLVASGSGPALPGSRRYPGLPRRVRSGVYAIESSTAAVRVALTLVAMAFGILGPRLKKAEGTKQLA